MRRLTALAALATLSVAAPSAADAFCGFYVSGADGSMFNNATQVVMMRKGNRTVLSMQNNYQGPAKDFAMIVPVPVVLQKENVKTLPKNIFQKVDRLASPRLVEYWEKDPCEPERKYDEMMAVKSSAPSGRRARSGSGGGYGVKIEAQFKVGEYEILILSAKDSTGLDGWLRKEGYKIPKDAEPLLRPYVQAGSKFFVAKVDATKVVFKDGMTDLSPLRFHYDHKDFQLPIRLGMANSSGTQDLIVHILAPGQRYEVANYKNVTIPTNLDVADSTRKKFGEFYAALFDKTLEKNPGAVVTEYSWDSGTCDPCPTPPLRPNDLATLGADVLSQGGGGVGGRRRSSRGWGRGMVLTRLHARYKKGSIKDDLVFRAASPIMGGREVRIAGGKLEERARPSGTNNFQGRYAIRHAWTGPIACASPRRGRWGGPPAGRPHTPVQPALDLAFAKRGAVSLASMVHTDIPEIGIRAAAKRSRPTAPGGQARPAGVRASGTKPGGKMTKAEHKGCNSGGQETSALFALSLLGLALARRRRGAGCRAQ